MMNARYGEKAERRTYRPSAFERFTATVMGILAYIVLPALGILLVLSILWMIVASVVFGIPVDHDYGNGCNAYHSIPNPCDPDSNN